MELYFWTQNHLVKLNPPVNQNVNPVYINFSDNFNYDNLESCDIVQIENDIDLDSIPLTNIFYEIQSLTDLTLTKEFPILLAAATPSSAHSINIQQTEAEKQATKLLRQKFRYHFVDPEPNMFKDNITELQKIE